MININELHLTLLDILNKNNSQYVSPQEMDRFINLASMDYFNDLVGSKTVKRVSYGKDRILDRRLNPFRVPAATVPAVQGIVTKPDGLEVLLDVSYLIGLKPYPLREVDEMRWNKLFDNPLAEPIATDPAFTETKDSIIVAPSSISSVILKYLRTPTKASWSYTKPVGRPVYDSATSVNLEWDESEKPQLIMRIANYLGLDIRDSAVVQYTEKEKTQQQ